MHHDRRQRRKQRTRFSVERVARDGAQGAGRPLDATSRVVRQFGDHDLTGVRTHTGPHAIEANERLRSHAYTLGDDIVLGRSPTPDLLSHELAHVVQQRSKPAAGLGDADERQAERVGRSWMAMPTAGTGGPGGVGDQAAIQLAPNQAGTTDPSYVVGWVRSREGAGTTPGDLMDRLSNAHGSNSNRYFYTDTYGWVDVRHFGAAASLAASVGSVTTEALGGANEAMQWATEWGDDYRSGFSPEDVPSNAAGAEFGDDYINSRAGESVADALQRWMDDTGARPAAVHRNSLPATDPARRGGADRGSSNVSRTQSTVSGEASRQQRSFEHAAGQALDPWNWIRALGG